MAEVLFYHLTESKLEDALPALVEKTLARGWNAVVQFENEDERDKLDEGLWTWREDSFLPHATEEGTEVDARQPVLLTCSDGNANNAQIRFLTGGAQIDDAGSYDRVVVMFDGHDNGQLETARSQWKTLNAAGGHELTYWQQNQDGGWSRKA